MLSLVCTLTNYSLLGCVCSFMIFCLPGLLMMNAAIIKHTNSCADISQLCAVSISAGN